MQEAQNKKKDVVQPKCPQTIVHVTSSNEAYEVPVLETVMIEDDVNLDHTRKNKEISLEGKHGINEEIPSVSRSALISRILQNINELEDEWDEVKEINVINDCDVSFQQDEVKLTREVEKLEQLITNNPFTSSMESKKTNFMESPKVKMKKLCGQIVYA